MVSQRNFASLVESGLGAIGIKQPVKRTYDHTRIVYQWLKYRIRGHRLGSPFQLIEVKPESIEYTVSSFELPEEMPLYGISSGKWDHNNRKLIDSPIYNMFDEHFLEGVPWEETNRYQSVINQLGTGGEIRSFSGTQTKDEYDSYLSEWDSLFKTLNEEGYKTQRELSKKSTVFEETHSLRNEINIFVGRNGKLICRSGKHRAIAARLIGLESVPVFIRIRHTEWQKIRNRIAQGGCPPEQVKQHPDIRSIRK